MSKKIGIAGACILAVMLLAAIAAPFLAPYDPYTASGSPFMRPSSDHLLGTNDIGQDIFSELIYGTRTSLAIGFLSAVISISIGTAIGMTAGWFGGWLDRFLMKLTAFFMTIPFIPAVIILSAFTKPGFLTTSLILGGMSWSGTARIVRGETIAIRNKEYVQTILAMDAGPGYILIHHVIKEIFPLILYRGVGRVKAGILGESSLSFLGLGSTVQKSWGTMIYYAQAKNALLTDAWLWWILPPGISIALLSCALVMVSYYAEERADRRLEEGK